MSSSYRDMLDSLGHFNNFITFYLFGVILKKTWISSSSSKFEGFLNSSCWQPHIHCGLNIKGFERYIYLIWNTRTISSVLWVAKHNNISSEVGMCTLHYTAILKEEQLFAKKRLCDNSSCRFTLKGLNIEQRVKKCYSKDHEYFKYSPDVRHFVCKLSLIFRRNFATEQCWFSYLLVYQISKRNFGYDIL